MGQRALNFKARLFDAYHSKFSVDRLMALVSPNDKAQRRAGAATDVCIAL
jgi:hypothetical protein